MPLPLLLPKSEQQSYLKIYISPTAIWCTDKFELNLRALIGFNMILSLIWFFFLFFFFEFAKRRLTFYFPVFRFNLSFWRCAYVTWETNRICLFIYAYSYSCVTFDSYQIKSHRSESNHFYIYFTLLFLNQFDCLELVAVQLACVCVCVSLYVWAFMQISILIVAIVLRMSTCAHSIASVRACVCVYVV